MALTDKLSNIAEAIRTKTETTDKMTLNEMPDKILGIQTSEDLDAELTEQQQLISELKTTLENKAAGGVTINNQDKTITENGTYTADEGYTGLGTVTVDVASGEGEDAPALSVWCTQVTDSAFIYNTTVTKVKFSNQITQIGTAAFRKSLNLTEAYVPSSVIEIGSGAFQDNENFTKLTIAEDSPLTSISSNLVRGTSITEFTIPALVSSIKNAAFYDCKKLKTVYVKPITPPTLGIYDFYNCSALAQIIVPVGCADTYKSATNWANYADIIIEEGA